MSRVGSKIIEVPKDVIVNVNAGMVGIKGPKGTLDVPFHGDMSVTQDNGTILVERPSDSKTHRSLHGTTRQLIANGIQGVAEGYSKDLEIRGAGDLLGAEQSGFINDIGFETYQKILKEAVQKHKFKINFTEYDFASCDYYEKNGKMLPDNWKEKLGKHDAIFFGAVGMPDQVPDHISLWGSLLQFRREFDQYINLRPVKLFPGIDPPLANKKPGDIDMLIVRENTEGEYSSVGGRMYKNTDREIAIQETIMSAHGVDRVQKFAFELANNIFFTIEFVLLLILIILNLLNLPLGCLYSSLPLLGISCHDRHFFL